MKEKYLKISERIIEYCAYGIILFIPASSAIVEVCSFLGILLFLIKKILKPDFKFFEAFPHIFLVLFIFFSALSMFNSGIYIKKSLITLFFKWLEYAFIFLLIEGTFKKSALRIKKAVIVLLICAGIVGVSGLSQGLLGFEFIRNRALVVTDSGLVAVTGTFRHFNDFGVYLIVSLSLVIGILLLNRLKIISKFLLNGLFVILITCLFLTLSRGSWLAFLFSLILMIILSRKARILFFLLCAFIILLNFLPGVSERKIFTFQPPLSFIFNDADRFQMWQAAFKMVKENPLLGKGVGTFMDYFSKYKPNLYVQYAHNCLLQIWAETGIFSLLSFLFFAGSVLFQAIKKFKKNNDFMLLGLVAGMFGFLIHSFFDTDLYSLQLSVLFWAFMGLISAKTNAEC